VKLKDYLLAIKMSHKEFAKKIGASASAVDFYCRGDRSPSLERSIKIWEVTKGKVSIDDLAVKRKKVK
jgi:transcriptional regulator with XRE-family HTH domain